MATDATLVLDIDSSGAVGAARALDGLNRYAAATATVAAKLETQFRKTNGQFQSQIDFVAENEREIRQLAQAYNPVLSASLRFAEAQKEVARAVQLGVIPSSRQADVLRQLQREYAVAADGGNRFFRVLGGGVGQVQNASYQIGDFFVQIASGQSATMALSQQLPQLLGGFGAVGAAAGAAVAILGAVWMVMGNGESAAQKLTRSVERVTGAISEMRSLSASVSFDGLDQLREKYGQVDQQVINLINNQRMYNELVASSELKNSIAEIAKFAEGRFYDIGISNAASAVLKLRSAFNVTKNDAEALRQAFVAVGEASGPEQQVTALERLSDYLRIVLSNSEKVTEEQLETYKAVLDATDAAKQLLAVSGRMPGAFENAASAARGIADALNNAVKAAARLASSAITDQRFAQIELDYRKDPLGRARALAAARFDAETAGGGIDSGLFNKLRNDAINAAEATARLNLERERLDELDRKAEQRSGGGGGAGARELKAAEKGFQSLRELLEKDSQFQFAEYEKRNLQLQEALNKNLVTEQSYRELSSQLKLYYFGTEYEQQQVQYQLEHDALRQALDAQYITRQQYEERVSALNAGRRASELQGYATFFNNLANVAKAGGDKTTGAVRAFSVAQGLINSYLAFTQVLADPSLVGRPWLRTALAASTLASGLAQVSAMRSAGGGGGGAQAAATQTQAAVQAQPTRYVNISLDGLTTRDAELIESVISEIESQSKDGRKIIFNRG